MNSISIILADSQYLIRRGLEHLLSQETQFEVVEQSVREDDLLKKVRHHRPRVVILDYQQPGNFSTETVPKIKENSPTTNVLIISSDTDKGRIDSVLENGVNSFLTKCCDDKEIFGAIQATAKGEKYFCNNVLNYLLEKSFPKENDCSPTPLTARETEIVRYVAQGKIAKEIASELHLSTHTVYTHRKNIMKKLGFGSVSELVLYAVNEGMV